MNLAATTPLAQRLVDLTRALGERSLVWFGIRAEDAESLMLLPQFAHSFGVTAPMRAAHLGSTTTLEDLTGHRADLDTYDIDDDGRPEVTRLRREIMHRLAVPSAALTYRPSHFLSDILFAMSERAQALGLFKERQLAYEYKPWVETELARRGVRTVPWYYVAEEHRGRLVADLARGPLVLRPSRSSGGVGMTLAETPEDLETKWPGRADHLVGVAPFFTDAIPLNVGACVFRTGEITVHPASIQLIGIGGCTNRRFGYCGNDFAAITDLPVAVLEEMDRMTRDVGRWLADDGYVGAFGVDFLLVDGTLYFGEVNARLQGSTYLSCLEARSLGHSDIVLDHLAAFLDLEAGESLTLSEWAARIPPVSQLVVHNTAPEARRLTDAAALLDVSLSDAEVQLVPRTHIWVAPGAILARVVVNRSVTRTGLSIDERASSAVHAVTTAFAHHQSARTTRSPQAKPPTGVIDVMGTSLGARDQGVLAETEKGHQ